MPKPNNGQHVIFDNDFSLSAYHIHSECEDIIQKIIANRYKYPQYNHLFKNYENNNGLLVDQGNNPKKPEWTPEEIKFLWGELKERKLIETTGNAAVWKDIFKHLIDEGFNVSIASFGSFKPIVELFLKEEIFKDDPEAKQYLKAIHLEVWLPSDITNKNQHLDAILGVTHPSQRKEKYKNAILADDAESNTLAVTRVTNDESNVIKFPRASKVDDVSKGNPGNPEQVKNALQRKFGLSFDNRKKETALPNKNSSSHVFASLFQNLKAKVKGKKKPSLTKWLANIKNKMQKKTEKPISSNIATVVEKPLEPFSHGGKLAVICNSLIKKMPEAYEQFAHLQLTDASSWLIKVGVVDNHVLSKVMTLSDANHLAESLKKLMGGDERIKVHFSESAGKDAIKNYRVYIPKDLIEVYYNNNTPELNMAKEEHAQSLVRMYNDALEWVRNHQAEVNKECQIPENIQFSRIIFDKSNPETPFKIYMTGTDVPIQAEITLNNLLFGVDFKEKVTKQSLMQSLVS